ncbi:sigma-70 family RNA polymerase sigma factor [Singulisphaera rosea]
MNSEQRTEDFIRCLTDHQSRLFIYLVSLLSDVHEAKNVLQETNLELWRKSAEFVEGTDFGAWSRRVAHFKVLAHLRDKKRDRLLFDENLLDQIASRSEPIEDEEAAHLALRQCLAALPDALRLLISRRYGSGQSIREIARKVGKSEAATKVSLSRIRKQLMHCVEKRLATHS